MMDSTRNGDDLISWHGSKTGLYYVKEATAMLQGNVANVNWSNKNGSILSNSEKGPISKGTLKVDVVAFIGLTMNKDQEVDQGERASLEKIKRQRGKEEEEAALGRKAKEQGKGAKAERQRSKGRKTEGKVQGKKSKMQES
ncbi:hypothetical protein ACFE04_009381 [Oxalis oulophora]